MCFGDSASGVIKNGLFRMVLKCDSRCRAVYYFAKFAAAHRPFYPYIPT